MLLKATLAAVAASALFGSARADYNYPDVPNAFSGYDLILNEEFAGSSLNYTTWTPDWDCSGWGNGMRAAYTTSPKNLYLKEGNLNIQPICGRLQPDKTICQPFTGYPECACEPTNFNKMDGTSAQITTRHKFGFNQGKLRVRAKLSTGYYTWPAFWLYKDFKVGEKMPESGEIDVMEGVGKLPKWWSAVIHYQMKDPVTGNLTDKVKNENADFPGEGLLNETYHVYGLDWTAGKFKWTIDEIEMWTLDYGKLMTDPNNVNVFDDGYFHIILDVAIGGRMFGIGYGNNKPSYEELCADGNSFTATQIDYVRVYQEIGKHNFRVSADSDVTVKGSAAGIAKEGANCPFDGCVGTTWNQRVDEISGVSGATTTAAAPAASTAAGAKPTGSAAAVATTTVKPSGASGQTISMVLASALMVIAGFFASL